MPPPRYFVASLVALLIIAAALFYAGRVQRRFVEKLRQSMRDAKAAGTLPDELKDVDLETITPRGFALEVSREELTRITISDMLRHLWYVWIPIVIGICFGIAWYLGPNSNVQQ